MSRRMLALIVLALTLCWCMLTTCGMVSEPSFIRRLDLDTPSFKQIRSRLIARLPVSDMRLVSGDPVACSLTSSHLMVPESDSCVYAIQPDTRKTRRLSLSIGDSCLSVRLMLVQPNYLSVDQTLKEGDSIDLDIFQNDQNQAAELTIKECVQSRSEDEVDPDLFNGCVLEIEK